MRRFLTIVLLLVSVLSAWAQRDTCFWLAVPTLAQHSSDATMRMYFFSEDREADVSVSMPADTQFQPLHFSVKPGEYVDLMLAQDYADYLARLATPFGEVANRGMQVRSSAPITCYCQLTGVNGEAFVPRGGIALGKSFCVAMQNRYPNAEIETDVYRDAYSSVQVIATEDETEVSFPDRTIRLQRGQTYAFRSTDKSAAAHLTGMRITSNRPISVFSTDDSPAPHPGISGEDAVLDQLLPESMAGTDYIAVGRGLSWEGCFVQSLADTTEVLWGAEQRLTMTPYQTHWLPLGKQHMSLRIHASHPVQVFQISGFWNEMGGVLLPDIYRSGSQRVLYRRMADSRHASFHVIMPTRDTASLSLPVYWQRVEGDSSWCYAVGDLSHVPVDSLITISSAAGAFHLGIVDATSAVEENERPVMTSASYSYFSSYDTAFLTIDTIAPIAPIAPIDSIDSIAPISPTPSSALSPSPRDTVRHHLAVYGEGGYSHLPLMAEGVHWSRGYTAAVGLVYELERGHFLFQTGVGLRWQEAQHRLDTLSYVREDEDTQHADNRVLYRLGRSDCARALHVDIPVLVGGIWQSFYLLGGAKLGVPVWGETRMRSLSTSVAHYDQYYDDFEDMANHGLRTQVFSEQRAARLPYWVDLRMSLEMGVRLGDRVRLGAFGDFGALLPSVEKTGAPLIDRDSHYDMQSWPMTHVSRSDFTQKETHTFSVGLRFTYFLF